MVTLATTGILATAAVQPAAGAELDRMSYGQLNKAANKAIRNGHVYSHRWGDASPWLKSLCYEMVSRAFAKFGTSSWAVYIVNRESGCNPAAINSSSGTTGIAQFHPPSHPQYNYHRMQRDMAYAIRAFIRLSGGGRYTRPWAL
jgi:hypothetical protein